MSDEDPKRPTPNFAAVHEAQPYLHHLLEIAERSGAKNPMIAGGYLRNLLLGVPTNDIDLFHEEPIAIGHLAGWAKSDGNSRPKYRTETAPVRAIVDMAYGAFADFGGRYEIDLLPWWGDRKATTLDVVRVEDARAKLASFPTSISKVAYTLQDGLIVTPEFWASVRWNRKITMDVATCTGGHCAKVAAQFPKSAGWSHAIARNGAYVEELPPEKRDDKEERYWELRRQDDLIRELLDDPNVDEQWLGSMWAEKKKAMMGVEVDGLTFLNKLAGEGTVTEEAA
jgi:hypothetical protein